MIKLKTVGYYKEMQQGKKNDGSIFDYIKKGDLSEMENICAYLESGVEFIVTPGTSIDVINPENGTAGVPSDYTDGIWLWPGDLSYYVRNYNLKLPDEFVLTMKQNHWRVPVSIDDLDCDDIEIDGIRVSLDE